jgi:hypothetical protein
VKYEKRHYIQARPWSLSKREQAWNVLCLVTQAAMMLGLFVSLLFLLTVQF